MGVWRRWFGDGDDGVGEALYAAAVREARETHWYVEGAVPDTLDGRFDMVAATTALVLLRLEREPDAAALAARVTERFVDDMDAQIRQIGFGDMVVGKQVGAMMAMLGGRLGAYRGATGAALDAALARNLYRGTPPSGAAVAHAREGLLGWRARLDGAPLDGLEKGELA